MALLPFRPIADPEVWTGDLFTAADCSFHTAALAHSRRPFVRSMTSPGKIIFGLQALAVTWHHPAEAVGNAGLDRPSRSDDRQQ